MTEPVRTAERKDAEAVAGAESPRHDTAELPVTKGEMRRSFRVNEIYTVLVAILTAGGALIGAYSVFLSKAAEAGEKAAKQAIEEVAHLRSEVADIKAGQIENQKDARALYRAVMYRQPQERLEKPAPARDGGQ